MSKIIVAINKIINKSDLIDEVYKNEKEIFFKYNKKYKWSIGKSQDNNYYLCYYNTDVSVKQLSNMPDDFWATFRDFIVYSTRELNTREAISSFDELYTIVNEKILGFDKVLDDIISDF